MSAKRKGVLDLHTSSSADEIAAEGKRVFGESAWNAAFWAALAGLKFFGVYSESNRDRLMLHAATLGVLQQRHNEEKAKRGAT